MALYFEAAMIISFGFSWPLSVLKSWRSRTAKGKSLLFEVLILFGYICGITGKFVTHNISYVLIFYIINAVMVFADICLYFRNSKLDKLAAEKELI